MTPRSERLAAPVQDEAALHALLYICMEHAIGTEVASQLPPTVPPCHALPLPHWQQSVDAGQTMAMLMAEQY